MNRTSRRCSKCFSIAILAGAFLISSEMPLLASSPQQSDTAIQNADQSLPDAPQAQSAQTPTNQEPAQAPSGAAGAKAANVKGAPVAQPAGAAVAPARQRGHRSLLIKVGLVAAGAVAVGAVVALSAKSPARPAGAASSVRVAYP
jgi:hypothetical protein